MTADLGNLALYRPIDNVDRGWGVRLLDAGYATVRPHEAYPPQHHPAPYMFTWKKGRCLEDFHILFIVGGGTNKTDLAVLPDSVASVTFDTANEPVEWHRTTGVTPVDPRAACTSSTPTTVQSACAATSSAATTRSTTPSSSNRETRGTHETDDLAT